jgi:hypothetical protein
MPHDRINNGDVNTLTTWSVPLPPGVLTNAEVICELNSIQYGACLAHMYICIPDPVVQYSWIALASGVISMMTPIAWQGEISIPDDAKLVTLLRGHQAGTFRMNWARRTVTNIKEVGNVARAVNQPSS